MIINPRLGIVHELCDDSTNDSDIVSFVNTVHAFIDMRTTYPTGEPIKDVKLQVPIGSANCHIQRAATVWAIASSRKSQSIGHTAFLQLDQYKKWSLS